MFNILCELHFWNQNDGIVVDSADFGAFVYQERKSNSASPISEGKTFYCKGRGVSPSLSNKRPKKLRDSLTEMEQMLSFHRVIRVEWQCPTIVRLIFNNGIHSSVKLNAWTCDPEELTFDRFMVGKLSASCISDVALHSHHALYSYVDNRLLHAHISKPLMKWSVAKKWNTLDVKLQEVKLVGPSGRRLDKSLTFNSSGDMILIWWKCGQDEVYPWSPQVKAEDRANVHVYSLNGTKFDLICYYRTSFDPIFVAFSCTNRSTIYTIQQRVSDDGGVTLEWENAHIHSRALVSEYSLSLPLPTHISALALSPKEDKLLAACIDGSLLVADSYGNITNRIRSNLIASLVSWHPDGAIVLIGNNKGQLQWYDSALASITCQILTHDSKSSTLDVGSYFKYQPNLLSIHWNCQSNSNCVIDQQDILLLHFEKGPLVLLRLVCSNERRFSTDTIVYKYLTLGSYGNALNLLHAIDWEVDPELAITSLQSIVGFCLRQPLSSTTESAIEKGLGCFLNPIRPIPEDVAANFSDNVLDLARKFFHHLMRYQCFDKAFRLAIDLGKRDLFMDLYNCCKETGHYAMSAAAWERAELLSSGCHDSESSCDCSESHSSCEQSESSPSSSDVDSETTQELNAKIVPPLSVTSPLESAQNKFGYSSILHQYNYRRNPTQGAPLPSRSDLINDYPPYDFHSCSTANYDFDDYFSNFDQATTHTGNPRSHISDSVDSGNCIVHHPNIPASRAPLQFNLPNFLGEGFSQLESLEQPYCKSFPSSYYGVSDNLKVANARRINQQTSGIINKGNLANSRNYLPGKLDDESTSNLNVHSTHNNTSQLEVDQMLGVSNQKPHHIIMHDSMASKTRVGSSSDVGYYNSVNDSAVNLPPLRLSSLLKSQSATQCTQNFVSDSDRSTKSPIIASAETEDGKIKVVHFGLV